MLVGELEEYQFVDDHELKKNKIITICIAHAVFKVLLQAKENFETSLSLQDKQNDVKYDGSKYFSSKEQVQLLKTTKAMY